MLDRQVDDLTSDGEFPRGEFLFQSDAAQDARSVATSRCVGRECPTECPIGRYRIRIRRIESTAPLASIKLVGRVGPVLRRRHAPASATALTFSNSGGIVSGNEIVEMPDALPALRLLGPFAGALHVLGGDRDDFTADRGDPSRDQILQGKRKPLSLPDVQEIKLATGPETRTPRLCRRRPVTYVFLVFSGGDEPIGLVEEDRLLSSLCKIGRLASTSWRASLASFGVNRTKFFCPPRLT